MSWCCEYCLPTVCFDTCGKMAVHVKSEHPGQAFPNCCDGDADCQFLFGPGWVCDGGVCVEAVVTYPMLIAAEAVPNGVPEEITLEFTVNGVSRWTPYAESLEAGRYNFVFPAQITIVGGTYDLLGTNEFYIDHPQNAETYFKASYFKELPPPPVRVRFNTTEGGKVDWGEGPQDYGSALVDVGGTITVTAIAEQGYRFAFWRVDGVKDGTSTTKTFTINQETDIDGIFVDETDWWPDWPDMGKWLPWIAVGGVVVLILLSGRGKSSS